MSNVISPARRETSVEFTLGFSDLTCPGAGLGFPCDERGNLDMSALSEAARDNVLAAFTSGDYRYDGIERREHSYRIGPVVKCACGAHVECSSSWANGCDRCSREYNGSGQLLAPRSQWGDESYCGDRWDD